MKTYRVSNWWTAGTFLGAFLFYALSACYVLYPGVSTTFVTEVFFPEFLSPTVASLVDQLFYRWILAFVPSGWELRVMVLVNAALGAVTVMSLYRAALAMVRTVVVRLGGMEEGFPLRGKRELRNLSLLVGISVAVMGMVACPLWTSATRLLPDTLMTTVAAVTLTFAVGVRWRSAEAFLRGIEPRFRTVILMVGAFFWATFVVLMYPLLFPVTLLSVFIAGWILVQQDVTARRTYILASVIGVVMAIIASFVCVQLWSVTVVPSSNVNALSVWVTQLSSILPQIMGAFHSFETIAPMVFFAACCALFFGTFPLAYYRLGNGFVGQCVILVLLSLTYLMWPLELAEMMYEPPALLTLSVIFLILLVGMMVGSWVRSWYDMHATWSSKRVAFVAVSITVVCCSVVTIGNLICFTKTASGRVAQPVLEKMWADLDKTVPERRTLWWKPESEVYGILMNRILKGESLRPVVSTVGMLIDATDSTGLSKISPRAYAAYRCFVAPEQVQLGALPMESAQQLAAIATELEGTVFGSTVVGQRTMKVLRQQAARAYVTQAYTASLEEADRMLHLAYALDPENVGALLGIGALAREGRVISNEEELAARALRERDEDFRNPTPDVAIRLMKRYGPVRTPAFIEADRLHRLRNIAPEEMLEQISRLYLEDPTALSTYERCLAVFYLPEAEARKVILTVEPTPEELRLYFALYPWTETSEKLWETYKDTKLADSEGMIVLRRTRKEGTRKQLLDRALTFFLRDERFGYALFYVNGLLEDDRVDEAAAFVAGFNVQSRLKSRPYLAERLRLRVAEKLYARDNASAAEMLERWLLTDPMQPMLWAYYFTHTKFENKALLQIAAGRCLNVYPFHAKALDAARMCLDSEEGHACIEVLNAARHVMLNDKESYAHR